MLTVLLSVLMLLSMAACNGSGDGSDSKKQGRKKVTFWSEVNDSNQLLLAEAVKKFNDAHSDIVVTLVPQSTGYSANLGGTLRGSNPPNVVMIGDKYFKSYVKEGYLTKLDDYIQNSSDDKFSLDGIWPSLVDRFSYNADSGYSGTGSDYFAVPSGNNPTLLYYNATLFKAQGVNIVSVEESKLDEYNAQNGAKLLPHGFYVYDTAPASGLAAHTDGKYYVFNNRIPMNWEELINLSKLFTKSYNASSTSTYGFLNEWWFSFGWSVGGDCLEWDDDKNQYVFNLGDESPNYLVTGSEGVTVNGTQYKAGDILSHTDKKYVAANAAASDIAGYLSTQKLYKLPSIRDAFTEFCRLSQAKNKAVTGSQNGYGVSPSPTTMGNNSKVSYFTTGEVAIVCEDLNATRTIGETMKTLGKEWDVAPLYQYREYGSDGTVKTVNGTPVVGKKAGHNYSEGYAIPANAKNKDAAWEFIRFMAGEEGQSILMGANTLVPNQISLANSEAYLTDTANFSPANKRAVVDMAAIGTVGDWSYVEDGEWINGWANILNTKVRDGNMTLEQFFSDSTVLGTNDILKKYTSKKYNGKS